MINYDYLLTRIRKNGERLSFSPNKKLGKRIPNLVRISGPYSSGKTTLLHILAIAFYGHKRNSIIKKEQLSAKLRNLLSERHELTFKIEIDGLENDEKLVIRKKSKHLEDIEFHSIKNGKKKELTKNEILRNYEVILDIPDNPLGRLDDIKDLVRASQDNMRSKLTHIESIIATYLSEIKNSANPEKIEEFKNHLAELIEEGKKKGKDVAAMKKDLNKFQIFACSMFYRKFLRELESLKQSEIKVKNEMTTNKSEERKHNKEVLKLIKNFNHSKDEVIKYKSETILYLKKLILKSAKDEIQTFEELNIREEIMIGSKSILELVRIFKEMIHDKLDEDNDNEESRIASILDELIVLFEHKQNESFTIPGLERNAKDLLKILREKRVEYPDLTELKDDARKCFEYLDIIKNNMNQCLQIFDVGIDLKGEKGKKKAEIEDLTTVIDPKIELRKISGKIKICTAKIKLYEKKLIKLDIEPDEVNQNYKKIKKSFEVYDGFSESQYDDNKNNLKSQIEEDEEVNRRISLQINRVGENLVVLEKAEAHKYQDYFKKLQNLQSTVNQLRGIFSKFSSFYDQLLENENLQINDPLQISYNERIKTFMAKSMVYVMHIGKKLYLDSVDIKNGIFLDKKGADYLFTEFGTGESQAAYLKTQLKLYPNKKIIALFDETGNMDDEIIQEVLQKMRELYEEGKLILGVLVQPNLKSEIIDILNQ